MNKVFHIIGWIGIALVFAAVATRMVLPEQQDLWWWLAILGLAMVVAHTLAQWRDVLEFFSRRQTKYGAVATTGVVLALGILVAANYVLSRQNKRWDLTAAQQYSLSEQTQRILESLESPITILVFGREEEFPRFRDRLDEYSYASPNVTVEYVDVDRNPVRARQYEVQAYGTIVFEYEDRVERVVSNSEQELTNALIKAVEGEEQTVYFVQGHGERDPNSSERDGYGSIREALRLDNFGVETVVLAQTGEVPQDANALVIAGPTTDFLPGETDLLGSYLEQGGKVLLMLDPPALEGESPKENLEGLAENWGIEIGNNIVVDASGMGQLLGTDATVPIASSYPPHPITENFNLITAFPLARSIRPIAGGVENRTPEILIETGANSWSEMDFSELATGEVRLNEDAGDIAGPIPIALSVSQTIESERAGTTDAENETGSDNVERNSTSDTPLEARLVLFGDSDFATNGAVGIQGNRDLILNSINWLAQQENLIAIRPREPEDRRITLTADQQVRITWLSLLMIPGVILGTGVYSWWTRRR